MDANLVQQIYPLISHAEKTIPNLKYEDKELLTGDLYLAIATYYNKEIPKFLGRLSRLEALKKGKEEKYLENIKKQQDTILEESKSKQNDLLAGVYKNWLDNLEGK